MNPADIIVALCAALFRLPFELLLGWSARRGAARDHAKAEAHGSKIADDFARREREFEESLLRERNNRRHP